MIINTQKEISVQPAIIWEVLTKPEHIKKWLGVEVKSKWKIDSELKFVFSWDGKEYVDKGKIIEFVEYKIFSYSYWSNFSGLPDNPKNYSLIEFKLEQNQEQTILKLTHSKIANQQMYEHSKKNWEETLEQIKEISESIIN